MLVSSLLGGARPITLSDPPKSPLAQRLKITWPPGNDMCRIWRSCSKVFRHLFLVGQGASLAAVGTGAGIVKEADHFHGEGMSSAAFRHGPFEMLSDETFVLVFGGIN